MGRVRVPEYKMKKLNTPFVREFIMPTAVSALLAFIFKWDAGEIIWSFWNANIWLCLAFCFFIIFSRDRKYKKEKFSDKIAKIIMVVFPIIFSTGLIIKSGVYYNNSGYVSFITAFLETTKIFFPFVVLYVYGEIKNIFYRRLDGLEKIISFFMVFTRLILTAFFCFYFGKYIPNILLYLIVYSICFFPIRLFNDDSREGLTYSDEP